MKWLKIMWSAVYWLYQQIGKPVELEDGTIVVSGYCGCALGPEFGGGGMIGPILLIPAQQKVRNHL